MNQPAMICFQAIARLQARIAMMQAANAQTPESQPYKPDDFEQEIQFMEQVCNTHIPYIP